MESLWDWGISITLAVQSLGPSLLIPMKFFSFLGTEQFFFLALPVFYWCVDPALGTRIGVNLLLGASLNGMLKALFHGPRPYWYSGRVIPYSAETSFGVPSGHAQSSVAVWGSLALWYKRRWVTIVALLMILLVGFSRVYLGAHFALDVIAGWIVGTALLWLVNRLWEPVAGWVGIMPVWRQIALAFVASLGIVLLGALAMLTVRGLILPPAWLENAARVFPTGLPEPAQLGEIVTPAAVLFGLWAGLAWLRSHGGMAAAGSTGQRISRYFLGLVGVLILYLGWSRIFPSSETVVGQVLRYTKYGLLGAWIAAGAPWLFIKLGLAGRETVH